MVEAAAEHLVETSVEVMVEPFVMVEVGPRTVAVGAVVILVEVEIMSTSTPHVTLWAKLAEGLLRFRWRLGRRAARMSARNGVAAARFFK